MKRQNSIPQPLHPSTTLNINHQRKCSHDSLQYNDANPISIPGSLTPITQQHNYNKNNENEALNPILVTDLGNSISHSLKRVTLTEETIPSPESLSPASSMHTITFGFASAATAHFRKISADCESGASTSRPIDNNETEMDEVNTSDEHQTGLFFLRMADGRILPTYCHQPVGEEADQILQNINARFKEKLRKFIEQDKPMENQYVWIQNDRSGTSTVLSLTQLQNHFNSAQ
uniref:Longin domain-containing protein n=1 Tax=Panagrolaimus sp. PS1159 TaxID=55785 RepID=A0AC35FA63_9BILA